MNDFCFVAGHSVNHLVNLMKKALKLINPGIS